MGDEMRATNPLTVKWWQDMPSFTKTTLAVILLVRLLEVLAGNITAYTCLGPVTIVQHFQVYRIFTSIFVHAGLLHVAFNMLAFVPLGISMERRMGTVQLSFLVLIIAVLGDVFYISTAYLLRLIGYQGLSNSCAIGFSGVIFGLIVIEMAQSSASSISIFGMVSIPPLVYPWVLLLLCQFLMPNVSFWGHLSGILVGQLWVFGYLRLLQLSRVTTQRIEAALPAVFTRQAGFVPCPGGFLPYSSQESQAMQQYSLGLLQRFSREACEWVANRVGRSGRQQFGGAGQVLGSPQSVPERAPLYVRVDGAAATSMVTDTEGTIGVDKKKRMPESLPTVGAKALQGPSRQLGGSGSGTSLLAAAAAEGRMDQVTVSLTDRSSTS